MSCEPRRKKRKGSDRAAILIQHEIWQHFQEKLTRAEKLLYGSEDVQYLLGQMQALLEQEHLFFSPYAINVPVKGGNLQFEPNSTVPFLLLHFPPNQGKGVKLLATRSDPAKDGLRQQSWNFLHLLWLEMSCHHGYAATFKDFLKKVIAADELGINLPHDGHGVLPTSIKEKVLKINNLLHKALIQELAKQARKKNCKILMLVLGKTGNGYENMMARVQAEGAQDVFKFALPEATDHPCTLLKGKGFKFPKRPKLEQADKGLTKVGQCLHPSLPPVTPFLKQYDENFSEDPVYQAALERQREGRAYGGQKSWTLTLEGKKQKKNLKLEKSLTNMEYQELSENFKKYYYKYDVIGGGKSWTLTLEGKEQQKNLKLEKSLTNMEYQELSENFKNYYYNYDVIGGGKSWTLTLEGKEQQKNLKLEKSLTNMEYQELSENFKNYYYNYGVIGGEKTWILTLEGKKQQKNLKLEKSLTSMEYQELPKKKQMYYYEHRRREISEGKFMGKKMGLRVGKAVGNGTSPKQQARNAKRKGKTVDCFEDCPIKYKANIAQAKKCFIRHFGTVDGSQCLQKALQRFKQGDPIWIKRQKWLR